MILLAVLTAPAPARRGGAFDFNNGWVQIASAATNTADDNPLSITESTTTDGRVCSVGPYGWFCDPPAVDNDVTYYTPPEGGYKGYLDQNRLLGAVPEGLPPLCIDTCTDDCRPPCPVECVKTKFNTRSVALETGYRSSPRAREKFMISAEGQPARAPPAPRTPTRRSPGTSPAAGTSPASSARARRRPSRGRRSCGPRTATR